MSTATVKKTGGRVTVARYLEQQIALSNKSQKEIAEEAGYERPNILTMIKQGHTKLPINKIVPLARALGIEPLHLMRITFQEYLPEAWETLEPLLGQSLVTEEEMAAIKTLRRAQEGVELDWKRHDIQNAIIAALKPFVQETLENREGVARLVREKNARSK